MFKLGLFFDAEFPSALQWSVLPRSLQLGPDAIDGEQEEEEVL